MIAEREMPSWAVLVSVASGAVLAWLLWLAFGSAFVHKTASNHAQTLVAQAASSASSSASVAPAALDRAAAMAEIGQAGDAFGGANALFAALAGAAVLWAGVLQNRSLKEARAAASEARIAYEAERTARRHDQFVALFFQLLNLTRQLVQQIEIEATESRTGSSALDAMAWEMNRRLDGGDHSKRSDEELARTIARYYTQNCYNKHPSQLGPYFRLLFQTFKLVAESELSSEQQTRFSNIARGQISEGAVLLLAANGLTPRGYRFIPLIERFGLLEHLHPTYKKGLRAALSACYRERAFQGSKERETTPFFELPKCGAEHFLNRSTSD